MLIPKSSMPRGIPYIIGNEAAERFSYYGMKCILVVFMTQYLLDAAGGHMSEAEAKTWYHTFNAANYFFPILGALLSDILWGKYKTIIRLSIVYCLGHLVLALLETRTGLALGLTLIAIGSGGIKPCVSAHVGDQFSAVNSHLVSGVFSLFYFSINLGAFVSTLLTPWLLVAYGPHIAFGVPGLLMLLATIVFWMGRHEFVAIPPVGWEVYRRDLLSAEGRSAVLSLCVVYVFIAFFWALFDQTGSSWVLQAQHMQREVSVFGVWTFEILAAQLQALNPILVLLLIPLFSLVVYPFVGRFVQLSATRKIWIGMIIASLSFFTLGIAQAAIDNGLEVSIAWQCWAYLILTAAEVMVSITALEFSYTQAPNSLKSFIMGLFMLSVSLGNLITAGINWLLVDAAGNDLLSGAQYFHFFGLLMLAAGLLFALFARGYTERAHFQG